MTTVPAPSPEAPQRRLRLGRYDLIAQLGSGGMADVYLGVVRGPAGFNKLVVLKVLRAQYLHDGEFLKMFLDEARLSARFNHPHVVQTFEVEEDQGRLFLVMEYLEGHPLSNLEAHQAEVPLPVSARVLADVLLGLHYAHELTDMHGQPLGIVHRDVSPQNVFVTYDGPAKLLDFGVAKAKNALSQTQDGALKGKVRYMAPEQVTGEALDRRCDVFAAGILLWRAATGQKLWEGLDQLGIMHRLTSGEPVPLASSVRSAVPRQIDAICAKALALSPQDRFQTAGEFAHALDEYLQGCGSQGGHRAVARYLESRYAEARGKFQAFVDERLRALEGLPVERATFGLGGGGESGSRRWQLPYVGEDEVSSGSTARAVVTASSPTSSSNPAMFGALSDVPLPISSRRPGAVASQPPISAVGARRRRRGAWPLAAATFGLAVGGAALLVPAAMRRYSEAHKAGAPAAMGVVVSVPVTAATGAPPADGEGAGAARATAEAPIVNEADGAHGPSTAGARVGGRGEGARGGDKRGGAKHGAAPVASEPGPEAKPPEVKVPPAKSHEPRAADPCASPYFVDERGVKKIKPECL